MMRKARLVVLAATTTLMLTAISTTPTLAGQAEYEWQGRYRTKCRPVAWRIPATWDEPTRYQVIRTFATYPTRVFMNTQGTRYNMGAPAKRMVGTKNLSYWWSSKQIVKATKIGRSGLVFKYTSITRSDYRRGLRLYEVFRCKGTLIR